MSNIHVLERSGGLYRVVFHIAVPAGTNNATPTAVAWSAALLKSGVGGTTVMADGTGTDGGIAAAEKTSITAGTVLELVESLDVPTGLGAAALNAWIDARFAAKAAEVQADLQARLSQYGRVR